MTTTLTDPATAPTVAPVVGKRARLRNGIETQPLGTDVNAESPYCFEAQVLDYGVMNWTDAGQFDTAYGSNQYDIIAILDDEVAPEPQAEVAEITGYRAGDAFFSVEDGTVMIRDWESDTVGLTPAEARALLQVLPGLIKIAEGQ